MGKDSLATRRGAVLSDCLGTTRIRCSSLGRPHGPHGRGKGDLRGPGWLDLGLLGLGPPVPTGPCWVGLST